MSKTQVLAATLLTDGMLIGALVTALLSLPQPRRSEIGRRWLDELVRELEAAPGPADDAAKTPRIVAPAADEPR